MNHSMSTTSDRDITLTVLKVTLKMVRRKRMCDSSTQTEAAIKTGVPIVLLNRHSLASGKEHALSHDYSSSITIRNPSMVSAQTKPGISKPPKSYRFFAKPITNNEKFNSTLADLADESTERTPKKKVRFIRPGPLSYKNRILNSMYNNENLIRPPTMSEPQIELSLNNDQDLATIIEQAESTQLVGDLEQAFNVGEIIVEPMESVAETQQMTIKSDSAQVGTKESSAIIRSASKALPNECSMNEANDKNEKSRDNSDRSKEGNTSQKQDGKTILIRANFVHIYNHFYNGN